MALNLSHRPVFSGEDNLVAPMRSANGYLLEGRPDKVVDCFDYGRDMSDNCGTHESVHKDILDLLPADPFGMDIKTTVTALMGWVEDLEVNYGEYNRDQVAMGDLNYPLFAGINFVWNNTMGFRALPRSMDFDVRLGMMDGAVVDGRLLEREFGCASGHGVMDSACTMENLLSLRNDVGRGVDVAIDIEDEELEDGPGISSVRYGEDPHAAFSFALAYLGVRDLLVVETVCKTLHHTVRGDPLLWMSIHIDQPLNEKITDDFLLQLTSRSDGNLQCLCLVECPRITDDGLKRVLENNPKLTKLSVPGCTRLSIEGIVSSLKAFNTVASRGVKHLRIGGLYGMTPKHFEDLKLLLDTDDHMQKSAHKPHFYRRGNFYLSCEDNRAIDIEMCPRCENLRLVYDCPVDGCQGKEHPTKVCRACTLCIPRCAKCGRCINDGAYEETFCLELLCSGCWELTKCQERQDRKDYPSNNPADTESSGFSSIG